MAQFSLCCILVLFCFYFMQYPMQIENIVSNAAHLQVERSNMKVVFLPPNTTSKLQPCDAGIIQTVKLRYRIKVNLFDAIMWLRSAWDSLLPTTIKKCYALCGISGASSSPKENDNTTAMETTSTKAILLPVFGWGHAGRVCQA